MAAGFEFRYKQSGGVPTVQSIVSGTSAWKKGDTAILNASNQAILGVSGSATFVGVVIADYSGLTAGTDKVEVLTDPDAVYAVTDANARNINATLDVSGNTGAQTVTTSSNKEFQVVATKGAATDKTLVRFNTGKHIFSKAQ